MSTCGISQSCVSSEPTFHPEGMDGVTYVCGLLLPSQTEQVDWKRGQGGGTLGIILDSVIPVRAVPPQGELFAHQL